MSILDHLDNFYEQWVLEALDEARGNENWDEDFMVDVACVALNHLPPRYYRHKVDMVFYLSPEERREMQVKVRKAVEEAVVFVRKNARAD
ncbi:late competence development ComFB family protein [Marinobacteraceae bacterium S3BR75-40.1]